MLPDGEQCLASDCSDESVEIRQGTVHPLHCVAGDAKICLSLMEQHVVIICIKHS